MGIPRRPSAAGSGGRGVPQEAQGVWQVLITHSLTALVETCFSFLKEHVFTWVWLLCLPQFLRVEQDKDKDCTLDCTGSPQKPLCASDGRTFLSRCEFQRAKCKDSQLEVAYKGNCKGKLPPGHPLRHTPATSPIETHARCVTLSGTHAPGHLLNTLLLCYLLQAGNRIFAYLKC